MAHPRRYAKACDACYRKKTRCVYSPPACELCRKSGQPCKFTRIEKALPSRPRREKYFAALEQRMIDMESLLRESRETQLEKAERTRPVSESVYDQELKALNSKDPIMRSQDKEHTKEIQLPEKEQTMRLMYGYFLTFNHLFPIFCKDRFFRRMEDDYPPDRQSDSTWWNTVIVVLCFAHRLRAMSTPGQADAENQEACRYLKVALDAVPRVTYERPSLANAQFLLGVATTLQGTKISHPSSMLIAAAICMLKQLNIHNADSSEMEVGERKERERVFWAAFILDQDDSLRTGNPPLLQIRDIGRTPLSSTANDGVGYVKSLDLSAEVDLFVAQASLSLLQSQVWSRVLAAGALSDGTSLRTARDDLNEALGTWKNDFPFAFERESLVGHWPKYAIVHIVVLHFRYFQTLVELNKVAKMDEKELRATLGDDCPVARMLPRYSHSTDPVTVDAARTALDLASLTPRGNFQIVWLFFHFSISAVLTLLVNGIVRPFDELVGLDLQRVDAWLRVIDTLAKDSDRLDLLEKKEFLARMHTWTLRVVQEAYSGRKPIAMDLPCINGFTGSHNPTEFDEQFVTDGTIWDASWIPELNSYQAEGFPEDLLMSDDAWIDWTSMNDISTSAL